MAKKARTICHYRNGGKEIEPGKRSIHLVEEHKLMPPEKWFEEYMLPKNREAILNAMKKDRELRPPYRWIYRYFDFPNA